MLAFCPWGATSGNGKMSAGAKELLTLLWAGGVLITSGASRARIENLLTNVF